jgi:hypothetical protein
MFIGGPGVNPTTPVPENPAALTSLNEQSGEVAKDLFAPDVAVEGVFVPREAMKHGLVQQGWTSMQGAPGQAPIMVGPEGKMVEVPASYIGTAHYRTDMDPKSQRMTRRHELSHGYVHAAREGREGMPWGHRLVAAAYPAEGGDSFRLGVATIMDEVLARRVAGQKLSDFDLQLYAKYYDRSGNTEVAKAYRTAAAALAASKAAGKGAAIGAGATAAGAGAYELGRSLMAEDEQPKKVEVAWDRGGRR